MNIIYDFDKDVPINAYTDLLLSMTFEKLHLTADTLWYSRSSVHSRSRSLEDLYGGRAGLKQDKPKYDLAVYGDTNDPFRTEFNSSTTRSGDPMFVWDKYGAHFIINCTKKLYKPSITTSSNGIYFIPSEVIETAEKSYTQLVKSTKELVREHLVIEFEKDRPFGIVTPTEAGIDESSSYYPVLITMSGIFCTRIKDLVDECISEALISMKK